MKVRSLLDDIMDEPYFLEEKLILVAAESSNQVDDSLVRVAKLRYILVAVGPYFAEGVLVAFAGVFGVVAFAGMFAVVAAVRIVVVGRSAAAE